MKPAKYLAPLGKTFRCSRCEKRKNCENIIGDNTFFNNKSTYTNTRKAVRSQKSHMHIDKILYYIILYVILLCTFLPITDTHMFSIADVATVDTCASDGMK